MTLLYVDLPFRMCLYYPIKHLILPIILLKMSPGGETNIKYRNKAQQLITIVLEGEDWLTR